MEFLNFVGFGFGHKDRNVRECGKSAGIFARERYRFHALGFCRDGGENAVARRAGSRNRDQNVAIVRVAVELLSKRDGGIFVVIERCRQRRVRSERYRAERTFERSGEFSPSSPSAKSRVLTSPSIALFFLKDFISSPTICSLSAADPPFPQTSNFLPLRYDSAAISNARRTFSFCSVSAG